MPRRDSSASLMAIGLGLPFVLLVPGGFHTYQSSLWMLLPLSLLAIVALSLRAGSGAPLSSALVGAGAMVMLVSIVSVLLSSSVNVGIMGNSGRMTGLASLAMVMASGWCGAALGGRTGGLREGARWFTVVGFLVAIGSLMQKAGIEVPGYPRIGPSGRILGPMGSSSQLGAVMVLFIACAVATAADGDDKWRRFAAITVVPMTAVLVLSGARAAWVGATMGLILVVLHPAVRRQVPQGRGRMVVVGAMLLPLLLALAVPMTRSRLFGLADLGGGTVKGRVDIWRAAVPAWTDRWVMGWGLDEARGPIMRHLATSFESTYGSVETIDRAHSVLLDQLLWGGVVGLAAMLVLAFAWWRGLKVREMDASGAVLLGGIVAFGVHLLFNFPVPEVDALAWMIAGILAGSCATRTHRCSSAASNAVHGLVGAVSVAALVIGFQNLRADHALQRAVMKENRRDASAIESYEQARDVAGFLPLYRETHARALTRMGMLDEAIVAAESAVRRDPKDPILIEMELRARAQAAFSRGDKAVGATLVPMYEDLCDEYPSRISFVVGLSLAQLTAGLLDDARTTATEASTRAPRDPAPEYVLALIEETAGNEEAAAEHAQEAARRENL